MAKSWISILILQVWQILMPYTPCYEAYYMLNWVEHEIFPANKYQNAGTSQMHRLIWIKGDCIPWWTDFLMMHLYRKPQFCLVNFLMSLSQLYE